MDNFLERIAEQRKAKFPRIAMPAGLIMGDGMGKILEEMGANVYHFPTTLKPDETEKRFIEFRDPAEITDGKVTKQKLSDIQDEASLIAANLEIVTNCDGLFIPGGPHLRDGKPNLRRTIEEEAYKAAKEKGAAILGVCSGAQLMVLCEGGEIVSIKPEHGNLEYGNFIEGYKESTTGIERGVLRKNFLTRFFTENLPLGLGAGKYKDKWYEKIVKDGGGHGVQVIDPELQKMIGVDLEAVFSSHFMEIDKSKLPKNIEVAAVSKSDDAIEAIKLSGHKSFARGFMFHPEMSRQLYEIIIEEFLKSAKQFRDAGRPR